MGSKYVQKPPRVLRPDETWCPWCENIFLTGTLFERHRPKGWCMDIEELGMVQDRYGAWGYADGNHVVENRPRKSHAQSAFDRLIESLPVTVRVSDEVLADIEKVCVALDRERLARNDGKFPQQNVEGKRRSQAQMSFCRIADRLSNRVKVNPRAQKDIQRVAQALDRDRRRR